MSRHRRRNVEDFDDAPPARVTASAVRQATWVLAYLTPYRGRFALSLAALFVSSAMGLVFPYVTGSLIDAALNRGGPDGDAVNRVALTLVGVLAVQATFSFIASVGFLTIGERGLADVRRDVFARLVRLPMAFYSRRRVGELAGRLSGDLALIQDTLTSFPHFLRQTVLLIGGVALIWITSPRLALVMLSTFPPIVLAAIGFGRAIRRWSKSAQDRLAAANVITEETLQGIATVKAFANEDFEVGRYRAALDGYLALAIRGAAWRGAFVAFIIFALFGSIVLVMWWGCRLVLTGDLSAGELASFILYTAFVGGAIGAYAELYAQFQRMLGATQRVRELFDEAPEFNERVPASAADDRPALPRRLKGDIEYADVHFRYPSRKETPVLRGTSLRIAAGQRVALVGASGAGKSTAVSLLLRFYDPDAGQLRIDGRDARDWPLDWLRAQMAIVPQDVLLFGGSIADNIAYGRPGADRGAIETAARRANAQEFIQAFPDAYDTPVGERGVQLSGGQRQRIAIARAILRDPAILILDEATSSLDSESESLVQQALDELMRERTSVIIAHRLATVRGADRIFVLQDGRVVEAGTHEELLARPGVYRGLSELQFAGE